MPKQTPPRTQLLISQLRVLMKRNKVSQKDLAAILEVSPKTMQNRIDGKFPFTIEEVWTLEDHFGVTFQKDVFTLTV